MSTKYYVMVTDPMDSTSDLVEFCDQTSFREYLVYCILNNDYFNPTVLLDEVVIRAYDHVQLSDLLGRAKSARAGCAVAVIEGGREIR